MLGKAYDRWVMVCEANKKAIVIGICVTFATVCVWMLT